MAKSSSCIHVFLIEAAKKMRRYEEDVRKKVQNSYRK
jgi:hypothetical protein